MEAKISNTYLNNNEKEGNNFLNINLSEILDSLPEIKSQHSRDSVIYKILEKCSKNYLTELIKNKNEFDLGFLGKVKLPYVELGAINSLDLFGLDELIIFSFYWKNRNVYQKVADLGANIGLHSIIMNNCNWHVTAYEPDPFHINILKKNILLNEIKNIKVFEVAVSDEGGSQEFTRVVGNTTSSHLSGSKPNPYGILEKFTVEVCPIKEVFANHDFIKMDVEGNEAKIILASISTDWVGTDMMLEIGSDINSELIFNHLKKISINCFSQKNNWELVSSLNDMPKDYTEGSLFITSKEIMNW